MSADTRTPCRNQRGGRRCGKSLVGLITAKHRFHEDPDRVLSLPQHNHGIQSWAVSTSSYICMNRMSTQRRWRRNQESYYVFVDWHSKLGRRTDINMREHNFGEFEAIDII